MNLIATFKINKPDISSILKTNQELYKTNFFDDEKWTILTVFQRKTNKNISILNEKFPIDHEKDKL